MNIAGSLHYDTKMDTKGIDNGLDNIDKKSSKLADSMKIAIGNIIADLARIAFEGLKNIAKAGVEYNAQIEKYQTALKTLTGSAEEANKIIEQIKKDAASTPFDVNGLVQANQLLISAGVSSESAREDILALGNAISATGGGNEELQRMAVNLQQIKNVGKASSLDIKQFAYAGIDVYGLLADATGKSREEVTKMEITYDDLTTALKKAAGEGGRYAGAMEAQSKTFNGQISNLKDNLDQFIGEAMKPLFDLLKDYVLPIINDLLTGGEQIKNWLEENQTLIIIITGVIGTLVTAITAYTIAQNAATIATTIATTATSAFGAVMAFVTSPITLVVAAIGALITIGVLLYKNWDTIKEKALEVFSKVKDFVTQKLGAIADFIGGIKDKIKDKFSGVTSVVSSWGNTIGNKAKEIGSKFKNFFVNAVNKIKDINWLELGKNVLNGILNGMLNFGNIVKETIKKVGNKITNAIKDFFGISSPSKLMRDEIGQWLPKGIAVGIETNTDSVDDAIDDLNDDIMDKMTQAVNVETGKMAYSGTNGTITQMMSAFGTTTVVNENKLLLDGDEIYANQQTVTAKKNLQTQFGGDYSVSS